MKRAIAYIILIAAVLVGVLLLNADKIGAESALNTGSKYEPFIVEATAYTNPNGNKTSTGKETIEGITIAAKSEWAGCVVALYFMDSETGGLGEFYGYREVTDTGYGHPSTLYYGRGTIETGETVDVYYESYSDAMAFGSKQVYIQVIPGKG